MSSATRHAGGSRAPPSSRPAPSHARTQRHSQASIFKRSVLEHIADELMRAPPGAPETAVPIGRGASPVITHPNASPLEYLYEQVGEA